MVACFAISVRDNFRVPIGDDSGTICTVLERLAVDRPPRDGEFPGHLFEAHGAVRLPVTAFDKFSPPGDEPVILYLAEVELKVCKKHRVRKRKNEVCSDE